MTPLLRYKRFAIGVALTIAASIAGSASWNIARADTLSSVYWFCSKNKCRDGQDPVGTVLMDSAGNLYGTTGLGGPRGQEGTVFELVKAKRGRYKNKLLHSFGTSGEAVAGIRLAPQLIADTSGNLYGMAGFGGAYGGGTIFKLSPNSDRTEWTLNVLYSFCKKDNCADGDGPNYGLTYMGEATGAPYDGVSPLYGMTVNGGTANAGVAFIATPVPGKNAFTEQVVYSFCSQSGCSDGKWPTGALNVDGNGNLFGETSLGGNQYGDGVVFEISQQSGRWAEVVLHTFCEVQGCPDGAGPGGGSLLIDGAGDLIGTALLGGPRGQPGGLLGCDQIGCGVIFKISPNGADSQYEVLRGFCQEPNCADGARPIGGLVMNASGNLVGATQYGGGRYNSNDEFGGGVIYENSESSLTVLANFCEPNSCPVGDQPATGLVPDPYGNYFGTLANDTIYSIYELTPQSGAHKTKPRER